MDTHPQGAQDDGAEFLPQGRTVAFNGEQVIVAPLCVQQAIQISRVLKQVLPALDRIQTLLGAQDSPAADADTAGIVVELLADYGDPLTEGIAIAIGKPEAFVRESRDFGGLFGLVAAVIGVNADFFARQAAPRLAGLHNAAAGGDGAMPSTPSAAPATH